jgi:hypothetical protein
VLTQQQQAQQQQQPRQQQQQERQVTQALVHLSSSATAYCLLSLWRWTNVMCQPSEPSPVLQLFGVRDLQPNIVPGCKLTAAAAAVLLVGGRPQAGSSSSSSSDFWGSAVSATDLWCEVSLAVCLVADSTLNEYQYGVIAANRRCVAVPCSW